MLTSWSALHYVLLVICPSDISEPGRDQKVKAGLSAPRFVQTSTVSLEDHSLPFSCDAQAVASNEEGWNRLPVEFMQSRAILSPRSSSGWRTSCICIEMGRR